MGDDTGKATPPAERAFWQRAKASRAAVGALATLALLFWVNALFSHYRFNVALAVLASVPLIYIVLRAAITARLALRITPAKGPAKA